MSLMMTWRVAHRMTIAEIGIVQSISPQSLTHDKPLVIGLDRLIQPHGFLSTL